MEAIWWVLDALGTVTTVIGLVGVPESGRKWLRYFGHLQGESARWVAVLGGLLLSSFAAFLGMSPRVTFAMLVGAVAVAAFFRLYQTRQGLPNWGFAHKGPPAQEIGPLHKKSLGERVERCRVQSLGVPPEGRCLRELSRHGSRYLTLLPFVGGIENSQAADGLIVQGEAG